MTERILSIEEAAEQVPLSPRQLRRVAVRGGGPFRKVENRWMVFESELHAWVRSHEPRTRSDLSHDPMPDPIRPRSRGSFRSEVVELDARRRAAV